MGSLGITFHAKQYIENSLKNIVDNFQKYAKMKSEN